MVNVGTNGILLSSRRKRCSGFDHSGKKAGGITMNHMSLVKDGKGGINGKDYIYFVSSSFTLLGCCRVGSELENLTVALLWVTHFLVVFH